jgi:uncharacterized protein
MSAITVIKRDLSGAETWRYEGCRLRSGEDFVVLEALFNRDDMAFMGTVLKRGDRFVETFYTNRWYNVFVIYDRDSGFRKGMYCNITFPAVFEGADVVSYVDLALDLWVTPDLRFDVLDEEEFAALELDEITRATALAALNELKSSLEDYLMD